MYGCNLIVAKIAGLVVGFNGVTIAEIRGRTVSAQMMVDITYTIIR
jgi:hypothetical protein